MGPSFVKSKWQESGLQLKQWMSEDQVRVIFIFYYTQYIQNNKPLPDIFSPVMLITISSIILFLS